MTPSLTYLPPELLVEVSSQLDGELKAPYMCITVETTMACFIRCAFHIFPFSKPFWRMESMRRWFFFSANIVDGWNRCVAVARKWRWHQLGSSLGEFQPQGCTPATRWHTSSMCHACAVHALCTQVPNFNHRATWCTHQQQDGTQVPCAMHVH